MSWPVYNYTNTSDIRKWRFLPIRGIYIYFAEDEEWWLFNFKKGVSWDFKPIIRNNDIGGTETVAYQFLFTGVCLQNNLAEQLPFLKKAAENKPLLIDLLLADNLDLFGLSSSGDKLNIQFYNADTPINVMDFDINWNIKQTEYYPEITININILFSSEVIDLIYTTTDKIFNQIWRDITWS